MEINAKSKAIQKRIKSNKEEVLDQLIKTPIVQIACSKAAIGRATYYRWRKKDRSFSQKADEAIFSGRLFINDLAESKLLSAIQDQNMTGIIFWLKHNHPSYTTRVEVAQVNQQGKEKLSPEEEKQITKAIKMAGLLKIKRRNHENKQKKSTKSRPKRDKKDPE